MPKTYNYVGIDQRVYAQVGGWVSVFETYVGNGYLQVRLFVLAGNFVHLIWFFHDVGVLLCPL